MDSIEKLLREALSLMDKVSVMGMKNRAQMLDAEVKVTAAANALAKMAQEAKSNDHNRDEQRKDD